MANKFLGGDIVAGSSSVSVPVFLRSKDDLTAVTGLTYLDISITYWRQGGTVVPISPATLGAIDSAYSSGGFIEAAEGAYRLDLPDAMVASGADWVLLTLTVNSSGFNVFNYPFMFTLTTNTLQTIDISTVDTKVDRVLGLNYENSYMHTQIYTSGKLVSYLLDLYDSKANADTHDGTTGIVAKYAGLFTYSGEEISSFKITRES